MRDRSALFDHCFAGWNRQAQICWPSQNLTLTMTASEALSHLVVFTPEDMDFFAVEPVSHANNAFNMATPTEHGLRNVDANGCYEVTMSFSIEEPSMTYQVQTVLAAQAHLGECPIWCEREQVLYWVDILAPALNRFDPATGENTVMPMPAHIGCFAMRETGGFIVALRDGIFLTDQDGQIDRKSRKTQPTPRRAASTTATPICTATSGPAPFGNHAITTAASWCA